MPANPSSRDSARFISLFQKAHGYVAALQRVDDQIASLFEQRRKALEDLRAVQSQINNEFDRVLELDKVIPADMLSHANDDETATSSKPAPRESKVAALRPPVLEPAAS